MGSPTYRYHAEKAPSGAIFDSDNLPSTEDGWFDSPKAFNGMRVTEGEPEPVPLADFPNPVPYFDVHAYATAVEPNMPVVPKRDELLARGVKEDKVDDHLDGLTVAAADARRLALRYYAKKKYGEDLPADSAPGALLKKCEALDKKNTK